MAKKDQAILLNKRNGIGYITFNRPEVLNAFRPGDYYLFDELINDCDRDESLRAIIVTGKGRAWSVGDDVEVAVPGATREEWMKKDPVQTLIWKHKFLELVMSRQLIATQKTCMTLLNSGKVAIAAVNGICYIAEYLYAMDFVIAADTATFAQGDLRIGICPIGSSTQLAPRVLGRRRATELLLQCDLISAPEAWRLGLVNKVVRGADLMREAEALARKISTYSASAIKLTKMLMTKAQDMPLKEGIELELLFSALSITSGDYERFATKFYAERARKKKSRLRARSEKSTPADAGTGKRHHAP